MPYSIRKGHRCHEVWFHQEECPDDLIACVTTQEGAIRLIERLEQKDQAIETKNDIIRQFCNVFTERN